MFWKNVSIVTAGTLLSQLVPLLALAYFSRELTAAALGEYFVWMSGVSILTVVVGLRLELAVFNATTESECVAVVVAAIIGIVCMSVLIGAAVEFATIGGRIAASVPRVLLIYRHELLAAAAAYAAIGLLLSLYVYRALYIQHSLVKVFLVTLVSGAQVASVWAGTNLQAALIVSQALAASAAAATLLVVFAHMYIGPLRALRAADVRVALRRHWRFPALSLPADLVNTLAAQLPLMIVSSRFGANASAEYGLTNRALAAPTSLLAGSILTVFKEAASREYRETGQCRSAFLETMKRLAAIGALPFGLVFLFAEPAFAVVFGSEWRGAGSLCAILAPMFYVRFVVSPLSYTLYVADWQIYDLWWQVGVFAMSIASFSLNRNLESAVLMYSVGYSMLYAIYLPMSYAAAGGRQT